MKKILIIESLEYIGARVSKFLEKKIHAFTILSTNIGNGEGTNNREITLNLSKFFSKKINYQFLRRRKGDYSYLICNIFSAKKKLNWVSKYLIVNIILCDEIKWSRYLIKNKFIRKFVNAQK